MFEAWIHFHFAWSLRVTLDFEIFFWTLGAQFECQLLESADDEGSLPPPCSDGKTHTDPWTSSLLFKCVSCALQTKTFCLRKGKDVNWGPHLVLTLFSLAVHRAKPQVELMSQYWLPITTDLLWISLLPVDVKIGLPRIWKGVISLPVSFSQLKFDFERLLNVNIMLATEFGLTENSGTVFKRRFLRQFLSLHFSAPLSRELVWWPQPLPWATTTSPLYCRSLCHLWFLILFGQHMSSYSHIWEFTKRCEMTKRVCD